MIAFLAACGDGGPWSTEAAVHPLDDELTLADIQLKATHNSYHVAVDNAVDPLNFTQQPFAVQAGEQGVRGFELDAWWDDDLGDWRVYHIPMIDDRSLCDAFVDCLAEIRAWSDFNREAEPLVLTLEIENSIEDEADPDAFLDAWEADIASVWPRDRLIAPDDVQGDAASLQEAVSTRGWPTLGELRGRAMFVLDDAGGWRERLVDGGTSGRIVFPNGEGEDQPFAAFDILNDPVGDADAIAAALAAGHVVRTRADEENEEPLAGDTTRRDAALASGANVVSTDYPAPVDGVDYVVEIPGGTPSRCDPVTAPPDCTSTAIEDPRYVDPNGAAP